MSIVDTAKGAAQAAMQTALGKLVPLAPDSWIPGGAPDPLIRHKHGLIGTPVSRLDGPLKVQGAARFAAEVPLENMVYAALVYGTIPSGRIATLDTKAAEAAPGVVLVMTHRNAPRLNRPAVFGSTPNAAAASDLPIMQDDRLHWNGQPIAIVLAETQEQADYARSLIVATYAAEISTTSFAAAKAAGSKPGVFMGQPLLNEIGDAEAMLAAAPHKVDNVYRTPRHNHNTIEPHAATIIWNGDELTIHDTTQMVTAQAATLADLFDLKVEQVRVISPYVGGGFGCKGLADHQILGAAAARLIGRPVRVTLSREGVFRIVGGRTLTEQRVAIGAQADGNFSALIHTGTAAMTANNNMPEGFIMATRSNYAADSFRLSVETVTMNMIANIFMRAPGESVGTFALESAIDELAIELEMDPIELRIRNEPDKVSIVLNWQPRMHDPELDTDPSNDSPTEAIRVDNLVMKFTGNTEVVTAIAGLSFSVRTREFVSLVGPSGCGKSTCLGLIAGLRRPSYGEIHVCSNLVVGPIRNVGFMLQKDLLMPWRTVIGNVLFGLEIQGKGGRDARGKAMHYLERFGLQNFAGHRPRALSGGMRQRVALIRTLLIDPDIILLDEPFAALDFQTRLLLENELWRILLEERKTVLLITHDISEAISMSDRILVMSKRPGRIKTTIDVGLARASGSPLEARKHPEFNRFFERVWEQLEVDVHL